MKNKREITIEREFIMKTTIITCNPSENSFSKDITKKVIDGLNQKGKKYELLDLYKENFNPVMTEEDEKLYSVGKSTDKLVEKYQQIIKESDQVVFIFPIWWNNVPAMLKGFFDKVFIKEFAFVEENGRPKGLLTNIKSGFVITTSESDAAYIKNDLGNPIENTIIKATLEVAGMSNIKWLNNNMAGSKEESENFLKEVEAAL